MEKENELHNLKGKQGRVYYLVNRCGGLALCNLFIGENMDATEMEEAVREIIETPAGEYTITLQELWAGWRSDRKSSALDLILLFGMRARDEIQRRERIERETQARQREQERLAEYKSE
jgi:hypothetical protein